VQDLPTGIYVARITGSKHRFVKRFTVINP